MTGGAPPAVTRDDVLAAADRLRGVAARTPALRSDALGRDVVVKAECLQRAGSFKFRGAWNRIAQLPDDARVVAASSGNHAQAVALAAKLRGLTATIVMPDDAPAFKREATEAFGARVIGYDRYAGDRMAIARAVAEDDGAVLVPPFDDPDVIAGQGTVALELLEDAPDVEVLLAPASGGGLLAGCAVAAGHGVQCVAVEPAAGDDLRRSLETGERVRIDVPRTIADALTVDQPGALTFPLLQAHGAQAVTVTDEELVAAMRVAVERLHIVLEPGGAAALAVALRGDFAGARVGVVASGGNIAADGFAELLRG